MYLIASAYRPPNGHNGAMESTGNPLENVALEKPTDTPDERWMRYALAAAQQAATAGEVPVGAATLAPSLDLVGKI